MLGISVPLRGFKGKQVISLTSVSAAAMFEHILTCYSLGLCYYAVVDVLTIALQRYKVKELLSSSDVDCFFC